MSLQVWLPLNGDLRNQGVWNPPIQSCGSFTFTGTGKIGSTAAQGYIGWHLSEDILENTWSVAMWCKPISLGQYNNILFCKNISDSADCHIYFSIIGNTILNIGVNGPSSSLSYSYNFTLSQWYHVAATYDGSRVTLYINGNEVNHTTVSTAKPSGRLNMQINGRSTNTGGTSSTGGATIQYNDFRLYDHCLSAAEVKEISQGLVLHYKLDDLTNGAIDSSGYNYNGTILGSPIISSDTARYISSTSFPDNADGILSTYPLTLWNNAFTYSFWIKPSGENGGRSIYAASYSGASCSIEKTTGNKLRFYWNGSPDLSTSSLNITDGTWQHIAIVKEENKTVVKCYYNGVLKDTFTNTFSDKTFSGNLRIARDTRGDATSYTGMMSDFRIYCTALDADTIRQLYEVSAKIDNKQNLHSFEFNEASQQKITKSGQVIGQNLLETYIPLYDKNIYTEPDGSTWIHIFHHNNPTASKFNEPTLDWTTGKYLDADRWYDVDQAIYGISDQYEFMIKQKTTDTATETKYRWTQTANPLTATWNDVKPGTVTFNTSSGYTNSSHGGMYLFKTSNLHMCIANSNNGNWYGGIGAAAAYQGGIPGYPNTTVTSGYIDLYVRVYNGTKIIKNIGISSSEFIEL